MNLLEVYLLPFVYGVVVEGSKGDGARGSSLFGVGKGGQYKETGVRFLRMCEELLWVGAGLKPYRNF